MFAFERIMIKKNKLIKYFVLLLAAGVFTFSACVKSKKGKTKGTKTVFKQTIDKFCIIQTRMGEEQWKLEAQKAEIAENEEYCIVYKPWIEIYQNGEVVSVLSAEKGITYSDTGDIEIEGNVEIHSLIEDIKIRAKKVKWDSDRKLIVSDDFIEEEKGDVIITGWGLEATPDLNRIVIKKDVKATIRGK